MITDEQANIAMKAWTKQRMLNAFSNNITYNFDVAAMMKALEAYEKSKWIKFDEDNVDTWPNPSTSVMTVFDNYYMDEIGSIKEPYKSLFTISGGEGYFECSEPAEEGCPVIYWQPLPEYKEK